MKKSKKITNFLFYIIAIILILYISISLIFPKEVNEIINYKFYSVLTESMEPKIPTYSLVCVKNFKSSEPIDLKPQEIITFRANRFGQNIVITHRFNKTEISEEGETIYRTNAEGTDILDPYNTTRNDLIGTYIFHIPYIGKIFLFLKSKFGLLVCGELSVIFLIDALIRAYWEENNKK